MTEDQDYEKTVRQISVDADENIQEFNDTLSGSEKYHSLSATEMALITIARQLGALVQLNSIEQLVGKTRRGKIEVQ